MLLDFKEPLIIMMMGFSGSGKSYIARKISKNNGYAILSTDKIRQELGLIGNYSNNAIMRVYEEMIKIAASFLRKNNSVILDATFSRYKYRKLCYKNLRTFPAHLIECRVHKEETILKRLRRRKLVGSSFSEADIDVYRLQQTQFEPINTNDLIHLKSLLTIFND